MKVEGKSVTFLISGQALKMVAQLQRTGLWGADEKETLQRLIYLALRNLKSGA